MPRPQSLLLEWRVTLLTSLLAFGQIALAVFTGFDVVKINIAFLERLQTHAFDNIVVSVPVIVAGLVIDLAKRKKRHQIAEHRLLVLQATMRTVQDIVNNLLNNLQLLRVEMEGVLPDQTAAQIDEIIHEAASKIRALGNLDEVREIQMASGTGIDYQASLSREPRLRKAGG